MVDKRKIQQSTRQKILAAAIEEFAERGLSGARVDRIAAQAGVNKAMIYYHFSSKEKLYEAMIAGFVEKVGKVFGEVFGGEAEPDLESALLKIANLYHSLFGGQDRFMRVFMHEIADGGAHLHDMLKKAFVEQGIPFRMKDRLDKNKSEGRLRDVDSRHAIISFVGMNMFYLVMAPIVKSLWEMEDETEFLSARPQAVVDLFMHGIMVR